MKPAGESGLRAPQRYAWLIFALSFGLLISDYMARQVLNAVFPLLKVQWALSDAQLGALSGIVALMVGLLTFPLSLLADRWGRVRSLALMAVLWSVATFICGMARNYEEMFIGRLLVGVGEAAYGSVGIAVVLSVFPARMRATLTGAFMAGGLFGSVLGVGLGGFIAGQFGWRWAFVGIALFGLVLALIYPIVVRPDRMKLASEQAGGQPDEAETNKRPPLASLFASRSVRCAYVGSGAQLFVGGAVPAWLPSYFNRYYGLEPSRAALYAALFILISGVGMILCGIASDRVSQGAPERKISLAIVYCLACAAFLSLAFWMPPGAMQLGALAIGVFLAAATSGTSGAMVANLTPLAIHGTAFATLTLANNLIGLAPGPYLTGQLADSVGLLGAFRYLPVASIVAAVVFYIARRSYLADLAAQRAPKAKAVLI